MQAKHSTRAPTDWNSDLRLKLYWGKKAFLSRQWNWPKNRKCHLLLWELAACLWHFLVTWGIYKCCSWSGVVFWSSGLLKGFWWSQSQSQNTRHGIPAKFCYAFPCTCGFIIDRRSRESKNWFLFLAQKNYIFCLIIPYVVAMCRSLFYPSLFS